MMNRICYPAITRERPPSTLEVHKGSSQMSGGGFRFSGMLKIYLTPAQKYNIFGKRVIWKRIFQYIYIYQENIVRDLLKKKVQVVVQSRSIGKNRQSR